MREWLRLMQNQGVDVIAQEQQLLAGTGQTSWWQKLRNTWAKQQGEQDFSHEVMEAMEGCLACKACAGQCPIKVDVPSFRARFLQLYHSRYLRPIKDYLVGSIERTAPWFCQSAQTSQFHYPVANQRMVTEEDHRLCQYTLVICTHVGRSNTAI